MSTLEKVCIVALAAFWLASAAWPEGENTASAAGGSSAAAQGTKAPIPPLP